MEWIIFATILVAARGSSLLWRNKSPTFHGYRTTDTQDVKVEDLLPLFRQPMSSRSAAISGITYPAHNRVMETTFQCSDVGSAGYYADPERQCQQYYRCDDHGGKTSFLCPPGTLFHQLTLVCDFWYNVDCSQAVQYYTYANSRLYQNLPLLDSVVGETLAGRQSGITGPPKTIGELVNVSSPVLEVSDSASMTGSENTQTGSTSISSEAGGRFGVVNLRQKPSSANSTVNKLSSSAAGSSSKEGSQTETTETWSLPSGNSVDPVGNIEGITVATRPPPATTKATVRPKQTTKSVSIQNQGANIIRPKKTNNLSAGGVAWSGGSSQSGAASIQPTLIPQFETSLMPGGSAWNPRTDSFGMMTSSKFSGGSRGLPAEATVMSGPLKVNLPKEKEIQGGVAGRDGLMDAGQSTTATSAWNPIQVKVFTACDKTADVEMQGNEQLQTMMSSLRKPPSGSANLSAVIMVEATMVDSESVESAKLPVIDVDAYYITENGEKPVFIKFTKYNVVIEVRPDQILPMSRP